jgi:hypothetical protein
MVHPLLWEKGLLFSTLLILLNKRSVCQENIPKIILNPKQYENFAIAESCDRICQSGVLNLI